MTETTALLVSADARLLADLVRLAAAAGIDPEIVRDPAAGMRRWNAARVVLVGADLAAALADLRPPRRDRVHLVDHADSDALFRDAISCGAESVAVLPEAESRLVELLTDSVDGTLGTAVTVGVIGGSGGAGATVFACALAVACAARGPTAVVDADLLGAGVDDVLGLDATEGPRWDALLQGAGRLGARALRDALPRRDALSVLAWPVDRDPRIGASAVREAMSAARRGFGVVVVDLPRYPHLLADELIPRCDLVLLVSTGTVPAITAAARVAARLPPGDARLVLRGAGSVEPDQAADFLGMPVATTMTDQRGLDEAMGLGAGPIRHRRGPLARAAREVAGQVWGESR